MSETWTIVGENGATTAVEVREVRGGFIAELRDETFLGLTPRTAATVAAGYLRYPVKEILAPGVSSREDAVREARISALKEARKIANENQDEGTVSMIADLLEEEAPPSNREWKETA